LIKTISFDKNWQQISKFSIADGINRFLDPKTRDVTVSIPPIPIAFRIGGIGINRHWY
jgi:hypothetical protein